VVVNDRDDLFPFWCL